MKKLENLGRKLSNEEQKAIGGGVELPPACLSVGDACNSDVQCCSNYCGGCPEGSCQPTGKICYPSI
jgi:hypothetical protein